MPLDSQGFPFEEFDRSMPESSLTHQGWLTQAAIYEASKSKFSTDKVRLAVQLWAQYFDERRMDNPGERLLQYLKDKPACVAEIDKLMRGDEVLTGQRAVPLVPDFTSVSAFHDLVEKMDSMAPAGKFGGIEPPYSRSQALPVTIPSAALQPVHDKPSFNFAGNFRKLVEENVSFPLAFASKFPCPAPSLLGERTMCPPPPSKTLLVEETAIPRIRSAMPAGDPELLVPPPPVPTVSADFRPASHSAKRQNRVFAALGKLWPFKIGRSKSSAMEMVRVAGLRGPAQPFTLSGKTEIFNDKTLQRFVKICGSTGRPTVRAAGNPVSTDAALNEVNDFHLSDIRACLGKRPVFIQPAMPVL